MAGTSYFNVGSASNGGDSPFYKLKSLPLLNRTNSEIITASDFGGTGLPVYRSAVANNKFIRSGVSNLALITTSSAGTSSTINSTDLTIHLAASSAVAYHLNSTDQCLYVLLRASNTFRLIKMADNSGTVTTIGTSFTPANPARWPQFFQQGFGTQEGTMWLDGSGHISIYSFGYKHQLNKTTGAIVSQDTAVTIGSYNLVNTSYLSLDNSIAASQLSVNNPASETAIPFIAGIVSTDSGIIEHQRFFQKDIFSGRQLYSNDTQGTIIVDSDKLFLGGLTQAASVYPFGYILRADYDSFLRSVVEWHAGV